MLLYYDIVVNKVFVRVFMLVLDVKIIEVSVFEIYFLLGYLI